jgi:hypothetical protein
MSTLRHVLFCCRAYCYQKFPSHMIQNPTLFVVSPEHAEAARLSCQDNWNRQYSRMSLQGDCLAIRPPSAIRPPCLEAFTVVRLPSYHSFLSKCSQNYSQKWLITRESWLSPVAQRMSKIGVIWHRINETLWSKNHG